MIGEIDIRCKILFHELQAIGIIEDWNLMLLALCLDHIFGELQEKIFHHIKYYVLIKAELYSNSLLSKENLLTILTYMQHVANLFWSYFSSTYSSFVFLISVNDRIHEVSWSHVEFSINLNGGIWFKPKYQSIHYGKLFPLMKNPGTSQFFRN